jgi:hypothetical protein
LYIVQQLGNELSLLNSIVFLSNVLRAHESPPSLKESARNGPDNVAGLVVLIRKNRKKKAGYFLRMRNLCSQECCPRSQNSSVQLRYYALRSPVFRCHAKVVVIGIKHASLLRRKEILWGAGMSVNG